MKQESSTGGGIEMNRLVPALVLALLATPAMAQIPPITGHARVLDGDTIEIEGGVRVRLKGVDAAERGSALGEAARQKMILILGNGELTCTLTGEITHKREVGYCTTSTGVDIGQALIEAGLALACPRFSTRYVKFEQPEAVATQVRASYCVRAKRS
jgi:endonuclease YncB( thermonuclease family)